MYRFFFFSFCEITFAFNVIGTNTYIFLSMRESYTPSLSNHRVAWLAKYFAFTHLSGNVVALLMENFSHNNSMFVKLEPVCRI